MWITNCVLVIKLCADNMFSWCWLIINSKELVVGEVGSSLAARQGALKVHRS
jgi:hypothetical protein